MKISKIKEVVQDIEAIHRNDAFRNSKTVVVLQAASHHDSAIYAIRLITSE